MGGLRTNTMAKADAAIGARIRTYRLQRGMSQSALAEKLGLTFQQVQKYEKGANRVAGSRLVEVCNILQVRPEELLGNGDGIFVDQPDVFEALKNKDIAAGFIKISKLTPTRRRAVMKALLVMIDAFGGNGKL